MPPHGLTILDLFLHFEKEMLAFSPSATQTTLTGRTYAGPFVKGSDKCAAGPGEVTNRGN